jgi:biopolymer transport protein ExbB/TolQ
MLTAIDQVRALLHILAGLLIWPVLVSLLALSAAIVIALGSFLHEAWQRSRGKRLRLALALQALEAASGAPGPDTLEMRLEAGLQKAERQLFLPPLRLKLAVRLGPALGLMGTLIPMANALQGLATGNLPALASNLVTAFAATVVGLAISLLAFLMAAAREDWARTDAQALAMAAERYLQQGSTS